LTYIIQIDFFQDKKIRAHFIFVSRINIRMNIALSRINSCVLTNEPEKRNRDEKTQQEIEILAIHA